MQLVTGPWLAFSLWLDSWYSWIWHDMARCRGERERETERERESMLVFVQCTVAIYRYLQCTIVYAYNICHICSFLESLSLTLPHPVEASGEPSNNAAAKACTFSLASGLYTSTHFSICQHVQYFSNFGFFMIVLVHCSAHGL